MIKWDSSLPRITTRMLPREKIFNLESLRRELETMMGPYSAVPNVSAVSVWVHHNDPLAVSMNAFVLGVEFAQEETPLTFESTINQFLSLIEEVNETRE